MRAGDAFRFVGIADIHVWLIYSDPDRDPGKKLIVSFTTWQPHLDQACILEAGEHPFIVHRTVVEYPRTRLVTDAQLEQLRMAGRLQLLDPLSPALLAKVREGAMASTRLPLEQADVLVDQELVD